MKQILMPISVVLFAAGVINKVPNLAESKNTNYWITNSITNTYTNFLTFPSNRIHLELGEYKQIRIYKLTDEEWNLLTNYWREYVVTNGLPCTYGGPLKYAPK